MKNQNKIALAVAENLGFPTDAQTINELEISIGFVSRDPSVTAEDLHRMFVSQRLTEGFVATPDPALPTIPQEVHQGRPVRTSLVPWESLPEEKKQRTIMVLQEIRAGLESK